MSIIGNKPITRRTAIAGAVSSWAILRASTGIARQADRPAPYDLGHGLEIRDYRLFPTEDVMRFIVEIHNTSDTTVDTPTVGVVLPHLDDDNYGWANPIAGVIHPQSSQGLIGVAPSTLTSDQYWGAPSWVLCDELQADSADAMQDWDVEITWDFRIRDAADAVSKLIITNRGNSPTGPASVQGLVWDQDGRLCGASSNVLIPRLIAGEVWETWAHVWSFLEYVANPFALIDHVENLEVNYSLQPRTAGTNKGCSTVLPWG